MRFRADSSEHMEGTVLCIGHDSILDRWPALCNLDLHCNFRVGTMEAGPKELPELRYFEHTHFGCYISALLAGLACCVGSYNSQEKIWSAKGYWVLSGTEASLSGCFLLAQAPRFSHNCYFYQASFSPLSLACSWNEGASHQLSYEWRCFCMPPILLHPSMPLHYQAAVADLQAHKPVNSPMPFCAQHCWPPSPISMSVPMSESASAVHQGQCDASACIFSSSNWS